MPKKGIKQSAYFIFMKEKQEQLYNANGIRVRYESLRDLVSADWNALSAAQKKVYEAKARQERKNFVDNGGGRLASDGTSIAENIAMEQERFQQERLLELTIHEYVTGGHLCLTEAFKEHAVNQVHYLMAFNTLGRFEDKYIPCEVGLVEYSIKNGITRSYHKIIDYGSVPSGQYYTAMLHSSETHKLFTNKEVVMDNNYLHIWQDIISFLNPSDDEELPPIFALFDQVNQTIGCLNWLANKAEPLDEYCSFRVWSVAQLLLEIRTGCCEKDHEITSIQMAIEYLKSTIYDYTIGSSCDYHEADDSRHCALGYAKRNCYLIFSSVHKKFGVVLTEQHIPNCLPPSFHSFKSSERFEDAPSVPRSVRENDACGSTASGYDALEEFDDDDASTASLNSFASIGRGSTARSLSQSTNNVLIRNLARMNLGASGSSAGTGIGRGRPVNKS